MSLIALGVTGGIGAYKAVEIARGLQKHGHDVVAIMTRSARRFVGPLTFEAITRRRVITDQWSPAPTPTSSTSRSPPTSACCSSPRRPRTRSASSQRHRRRLLSSLYLATRAPVLMAPAMNTHMLEHDAVQRNLAALAARGVRFVDPGEGFLACGWIGKGGWRSLTMWCARRIRCCAARAAYAAGVSSSAPGRRSKTSTRCVRGRPIERAHGLRHRGRGRGPRARSRARDRSDGARPPAVREVVQVRRAAEMHEAVLSRAGGADAIIMAAAVANYTPALPAAQKIPHDAERVTWS